MSEILPPVIGEPFSCPELLTRGNLTTLREQFPHLLPAQLFAHIEMDEGDWNWLGGLAVALEHPEIECFIESDQLTLGVIKPHAERNTIGLTDQEAATGILRAMEEPMYGEPPLQILAHFQTILDPSEMEAFCSSAVQTKLLSKPSPDPEFATRWHRHVHVMTSGALTAVLLWAESGSATQLWLAKKGSWDPILRDPRSIRARFPSGPDSNLVHGSECAQEAKVELGVIVRGLRKICGASPWTSTLEIMATD